MRDLRHRRWVGAIGLAVGALVAPIPLSAQTSALRAENEARRAAETIRAPELRRHVEVLAHDSMRGRDTPSPELIQTAGYVAERFRAAGLAPGAGDGFLQWYPLTRLRPAAAASQRLAIEGPGGVTELRYGTDFFIQPASTSSEAQEALVLVGSPDELQLAGGRIALIRANGSELRRVFGRRMRESIALARPAGVVIVLDVSTEYFGRLRRFFGGDRLSYMDPAGGAIPVVFVAEAALPEPLARYAADGVLPQGWKAYLHTEANMEKTRAPNTIALLPGSDPGLRNEYVFFTAHMDHVGVGRPVNGDSVYNGADDNASGTATVIALAEAFARLAPRPRRSLVFMTVSGEEQALLGSRWYTENPEFPLSRTVADINMDMVGRNWPDTIAVIGMNESSLGPLVQHVSSAHPELDMAVIDDPWPAESFYTRSDHYNFARAGVPILFFFNGTHDDYHRPSDHADRIDYEKMARIGRLVFYLGLEVANGDEAPQWDAEAYRRVVERPAG